MTKNIKQFLEADALRTQGEWWHDGFTSEMGVVGYKHESGTHLHVAQVFGDDKIDANTTFIAAASRIAPELRAWAAAFEQVCEALDYIRDDFVEYWYGEQGKSADLKSVSDADKALTAAAPYRKLMGEV